MNEHLNGPFTVEWRPAWFGTCGRYAVIDTNGLCVALYDQFENLNANDTCERYNRDYHSDRVREWNKKVEELENE